MYFIIETKYVGPNQLQGQYVDVDKIQICTSPALWLGAAGDWAVYAHGQYPSVAEARAAITAIFGEVRDSDPNGDRFESDDEDVVETYKPGKYAPMSTEETANWADMGGIAADTTDERIAELVAEYEAEANSIGYTLDSDLDLEEFMQQRRQELRDDMEVESGQHSSHAPARA